MTPILCREYDITLIVFEFFTVSTPVFNLLMDGFFWNNRSHHQLFYCNSLAI